MKIRFTTVPIDICHTLIHSYHSSLRCDSSAVHIGSHDSSSPATTITSSPSSSPAAPVVEHVLEPAVDGVLGLAPLLEEQEDGGVLHQGPEHEEDADDQVEVDGVESGRDGRPLADAVEDVDQDEEEGDEKRHPAGHDLRLDEEGHPRDDDEHAGGQVDLDEVLHLHADQLDLEAAGGVSACKKDDS